MAYDPNAWYKFVDQNGNEHVSRGDNGYIQQSVEQGIPIYVTDKGEWFTEPFLELTPNGYVSNIPSWFKNTDEYKTWNDQFVSTMSTAPVTEEYFNNYKSVLQGLGSQGAVRWRTRNLGQEYGITDETELAQLGNDYIAILNEGAGNGAAKLNVLDDAGVDASAAAIARKYKELSKEELDVQMAGLENILKAKGKGKWSQKTTREALTLYQLLNTIADNPEAFGEDNEFNGLLEASESQKFQSHITAWIQSVSEGMPIVTFGARLGAGLGNMVRGKDFGEGWKIEDRWKEDYGFLRNEALGSHLRGVEGSVVSGQVAGTVTNMAGAIVQSAAFGKFLDAKISVGAPGSILEKVGKFSKTFGGAMVYDWFANDLPIDLSLFATDLASGETAKNAWYDESRTQPLFGLFGPEVPYGLAMNLAGDAIMDLAIPILGVGAGAMWNGLDDLSGGSISKLREKITLGNLKVQDNISKIPVIGTGLQKFSNWLFTPETASIIREGRKAAIAKGSSTFYTDAQNLVTLMNHYGAEVVAPMYKHLVDELKINDQIKAFNKNSAKWGGVGKVSVEWDSAKGGVKTTLKEVVDDDIPLDVKRGLLDYQRLEELRGEMENLGGLLSDPKKAKELAELEKRVEELPDEVKKFASDMSELNKRVEQMRVSLGLSTQEWIDALNADPRWKNYMTRQVLLPGGTRGTGAYDPAVNKLLTGKRTGFYDPAQTLSPVMSLDMKVHALGQAYAWNERAKALVGMEIAQGKVRKGAEGVEIAKRISEVRATIAGQEALATKLGYDAITKGFSDRMGNVSKAIKNINDKMGSLENLTVKAAFNDGGMGPGAEIKGFKADFQSGKIVFDDDALVKLDLSPADGASIIDNTYFLEGGAGKGVSNSGVPFEYKVEDNHITGIKQITSEEGLADSVASFNQGYSISIENVRAMGADNVAALNRMQMFYRDNNFVLPGTHTSFNTFYAEKGRHGNTYGYSPYIPHLSEDGGQVVYTSQIFFNTKYYGKDTGDFLRERLKENVQSKFHPKGSEDISSVPIHEEAHDLTKKLAIAEFNQQVKDLGIAPEKVREMANTMTYARTSAAPGSPGRYLNELEKTIGKNREVIEGEIIHEAMLRIGMKDTPHNRNTVIESYTRYARTRKTTQSKVAETIAESFADYAMNGTNANKLSQAIAEVVGERMKKFQMVASPFETMQKNGLDIPNGLFISTVGGERVYKFPELKKGEVKTEIIISRTLLDQDKPQPFSQKMWHGGGKAKSEVYTGAQVPILGGGKYWAFDWTGAANFGDNIESAVVSLKNPLVIKSDDEWRWLTKEAGWRFPNPVGADEKLMQKYADDMRNLVVSSGYDGVIVKLADSKDGLIRNVFGQDQVVDYGVEVRTKTIEKGGGDPGVQRAEWLDEWRQKNPYLKGKMDEEAFQKANLWDAFFQKEIRSYDPASLSTSPDKLINKTGEFITEYKSKLASELVDELRKLSVDDFDLDLAMMVLGKDSKEIADAMDNYIINQVEQSARKLAANMEGGATPENINTALVTLWSDSKTKEATTEMLRSLVPDGGIDIDSKVNILFDTQANGLAAYEALPLDTKKMMAEKQKLQAQLQKENKAAIKSAKGMDNSKRVTEGGSHIIHYKEGGEDVYVSVTDPVVASMLQKPYDFQRHGVIAETTASIANFVATTYRLGTTGMNPTALIRNVLRDPIQAMVTGGFNPLNMSISPEVFYKTLRQYGLDDDTIATVTQRIRNWAQSGTMTQEMRLGPGKSRLTYNSEADKINKKLRDVSNGKVINFFQQPLESWEGFFRNQIGQQSFVKNYRRTKDVNKAMSSALFDTSNVTTNFSHSIANLSRATSTIPYLSSAINGTVSFWRLFNMDPAGMIVRLTGGFMLPVMGLTMWNLSSEENRGIYETLPEWYKQSHLIVVDPSGNVLAAPLPEEIQNFAGVARKLIEYTQDATPYALGTIAAQGALGFVPFEVDGYFADDGSINMGRGTAQLLSGILPQAFTTIYEVAAQEDLFTGQDLSTYNGVNTAINTLSNIFGTGIKQAINSIGLMCGVPEKDLVGKSFQNTIARDIFGMGFNAARDQFMEIVGKPMKIDENGKETKATGLFAERDELRKKISTLDGNIATATDEEKPALIKQRQELIDNFTTKVSNLMNNYQKMFQITGGLQQWQKSRLVQVLTLGDAFTTGGTESYQAGSANQAYLDERGLAIQRYVDMGLPSGPTEENLTGTNSYELQAAINRFYGVSKQATQDFANAVEESGIKDVKDEFYAVMNKIYDSAEEQGKDPDYDLIEKIQARYLQMVDGILTPIINRYGVNILNNNDFIDAVRRQVNGMIPSDDWKQSRRNAKKFLSSKDFPTATVDVKKWLKERYTSGMKNRNIDSDPEVTERLDSIRKDIDAGRTGAAKGKIEDLKKGIQKANFYISSVDLANLNDLYNMVK